MASLPTILIVDDDPHIRKMLSEALGLEGFSYESAVNGQEALDLLSQANGPRIILLDLLMPVLNGRGFMVQLRNSGERARHKVIFVSGNHNLDEHSDLEPDAVLTKPFTVPQLLSLLESIGSAA